jgi:glyoxylase-like metal-dependent hydrolase (beta-lactamase superfamily II)
MAEAAFPPQPGKPLQIETDLTVVLAPNPSPMTGPGTNTYLLGRDTLAIIDPGPASDAHLAALIAAIGQRRVSHIFVTHSHCDHSALAPALSKATGAPVLAFGASDAGRSRVMQDLSAKGLAGGGEGVDSAFRPDICLPDRACVDTGAGPITALHTPGHMGNHLCFQWGDRVFTGDLVMGWASSLVSPPDGDLSDYIASLVRIEKQAAGVLLSGHGAPVTDPKARIDWLLAHRRSREAQIMAALQRPMAIGDLTASVYSDVSNALLPAAQRNVLAHLVDLWQRNLITASPALSVEAVFQATPTVSEGR